MTRRSHSTARSVASGGARVAVSRAASAVAAGVPGGGAVVAGVRVARAAGRMIVGSKGEGSNTWIIWVFVVSLAGLVFSFGAVAVFAVVVAQGASSSMSAAAASAVVVVNQASCVPGSADGRSVDIDVVLATIRQHESGNDYTIHAALSSASGAYQFTRGTWDGFGGYVHAADAPPAVQDQKARQRVEMILEKTGDLALVGPYWYIGHVPQGSEWDRVPFRGAGNVLTPRAYQREWFEVYDKLSGNAAGGGTGSGVWCVPGEPLEVDPSQVTAADLKTVQGFTVHVSIADQVDAMVTAAREAGFTLTGWGYRDHQRQIELRREHCGSSEYAIWRMPSSQCRPPTARPGFSMHERGQALDLQCGGRLIASRASACFKWLSANAERYGLFNLASEPWHWSVNGK